MLGKLSTKLVVKLLKWSDLDIRDRNILTTQILDSLMVLPIYDIIKISEEGSLIINNRPVDIEKARILRESAIAALSNQSLRAVHDQVLFEAVSMGVHNVDRPEQMFFARAAIWYAQHEVNILKTLAQQGANVIEE